MTKTRIIEELIEFGVNPFTAELLFELGYDIYDVQEVMYEEGIDDPQEAAKFLIQKEKRGKSISSIIKLNNSNLASFYRAWEDVYGPYEETPSSISRFEVKVKDEGIMEGAEIKVYGVDGKIFADINRNEDYRVVKVIINYTLTIGKVADEYEDYLLNIEQTLWNLIMEKAFNYAYELAKSERLAQYLPKDFDGYLYAVAYDDFTGYFDDIYVYETYIFVEPVK